MRRGPAWFVVSLFLLVLASGPGCSSGNEAQPGVDAGGANAGGADAGGADAGADAGGADAGGADAGGTAGQDGGVASSSVSGNVTNVKGNALAGVVVHLGSAQTTSAADGTFSLAAKPASGQIVRLEKTGYVTSAWPVDVIDGVDAYLPVVMMALAPVQQLDAVLGGNVVGARGASIAVPTNAFVDEAGQPVTGQVDVSLTPYDPAVPAEAMSYPGELRGLTLGGELVPLRTYGLLDVTVMQNGEVLSVAPGKSIDIQVPAPSLGTTPATMRMWHFDTTQALWTEESQEGAYDAASNTYSATIGAGAKLDYLENSDNPYRPSCIHGVIVDDTGKPVRGAHITAQSADENDTVGVYSSMNTGLNGAFCMTVEMEQKVLLRVTTPGQPATERVITAGSVHSNDYPTNCATSNCTQVRTIGVGTPDPGEATEADCEIDASVSSNPFSGTCASQLGDFYGCFSPQGACTSEINFGAMVSYEVEFENGARIESDFNPLPVMNFYGPSGLYCGSWTTDGTNMTIEPRFGGSFTIETQEDGSMTIDCGLVSFTMSAEQMDAIAACGGHAGDVGSGVECTPKPGSFTASCISDLQCDTGLACCGPASSPEKQCLMQAMCDASCASNVDCVLFGHDYVCCSNGLFDSCMLPEDCQ